MRNNRLLQIVVFLYLTVGLVYEQATPTFESSDEVWHYGMVRELAEGRGLPVQVVGRITPYRQEGSQTPIYYGVAALLTSWIDISDFDQRFVYNPFGQAGVPGTLVNANMMRHSAGEDFPWTGVTLAVHILRWFSLLLGIGTILLTQRIAELLFPGRRVLAWLAAAITAFNPMFLFISAAVNNDNALWLVSSLAICLVLYAVKMELSEGADETSSLQARLLIPKRLPWTLGVLLSLAIMVKLSGLVLAPVIALFFVWRVSRTRDWREFVRHGAIVSLSVVVLTGWWFIRNLNLYDELLGVRIMSAIVGVERPRPATVLDLLGEVQGWWFSLWGVFGAFSVLPGSWVYALYSSLTSLAVAGGAAFVIRSRTKSRSSYDQYIPHGFAFVFIGLTLAGIIYWTYTQYASQGRLVLGAIGPMSTFIAAGVLSLFGKRLEMLVAGIIALVLFCVALLIPFQYISPVYAPPQAQSEAELPANLRPVQAVFNDEIELIGYWSSDALHSPGDLIEVTLAWRARSPIAEDYNLALNIHGREFEPVAKLDTWPGGGLLPTAAWEPGAIYLDTYPMLLREGARTPSLLRLDIVFWKDELSNRLPISAADGSPLPSIILDVGRLAKDMPAALTPTLKDGSTLANGFKLQGFDLPVEVQAGEEVQLVLYWEATQRPTANYTVFLHLEDDFGETVAQADSPPLAGDWPTAAWEAGMTIVDAHILRIPAELSPGEYRLAIGLYDPESGARLPAFSSDGEEWRDWAIRSAALIITDE